MPETGETVTVTPALTAEEWAQQVRTAGGVVIPLDFGRDCRHEVTREYHRLAALALYDQPFGFTREDVAMLRRAANAQEFYGEGGTYNADVFDAEDKARLLALADRIEALLPPHP